MTGGRVQAGLSRAAGSELSPMPSVPRSGIGLPSVSGLPSGIGVRCGSGLPLGQLSSEAGLRLLLRDFERRDAREGDGVSSRGTACRACDAAGAAAANTSPLMSCLRIGCGERSAWLLPLAELPVNEPSVRRDIFACSSRHVSDARCSSDVGGLPCSASKRSAQSASFRL